jgi:peptidoglycan/LPS O-acetylase OafA/YrhL
VFCYISSSGTTKENNQNHLKFLLAVPAILVFSLILELKGMGLYAAGLNSDVSTIMSYVLFDIVIISFCLLQVEIANLFFDDFSPKTKDLIFLIAFASFAVYLFHRPILTVFYGGTLVFGIPVIIENCIMIFIAVPLVFIISYYIQYYEEKIRLASLTSSR